MSRPEAQVPNRLLDLPAVRYWQRTVEWGRGEGLYGYQQPLDGRSGPRVQFDGRTLLQLSAYDYLGLLGHKEIEAAAIDALRHFGTGTGGVRMLTGTATLHHALESDLAAFKGTEAALTFSSGYLANLAAIGALMRPRDRVLLDAKAHRSLWDACRLSGVVIETFAHNDLAGLERALSSAGPGRRTLIVVDGIYSMDGDFCPLPGLVALKERYGAFLLVDEAHALGSAGPTGRGTNEHFGMPASTVDIWTGSLSKAIPSNGGFVAGSQALVSYLQHAAAPFWFSAALCPAATAAAQAALRVIDQEPHRLERLRDTADRLRKGLRDCGFDTGDSISAVVPVLVGSDTAAWKLARRLQDEGVLASAVVCPAVSRGQARLRLCASAAFTPSDVDDALGAFRRIPWRPDRP